MVLVDTSVWIRFLMGRQPYLQELGRLLTTRAAVGHELVYGELLIGDQGGRPRVLTLYDQIVWVSTVSHREIAHFVRTRKLHGRGLSWIDVHLLGSAIVERARLWTADERFAQVAGELGVAYGPVHNEH